VNYHSAGISFGFYELLTKLVHIYARSSQLYVCKDWLALVHTYNADVTANKQRHKSRVREKKTAVLIAQKMCLTQ
jgi:TPP-dependent indolepyruvate ferredoxin oxidoreductase alpha subunit